jgi:hypothetical protein
MTAMLIAGHLVLTAGVAAIFARHSGYDLRVVAAHVLLAAEWDLALLCLVRALVAFGGRPSIWPRRAAQIAAVVTGTAQLYLYALNIVSNLSWNRNMTAHLVSAFAPTVWSGKEPFPVGAAGISAFALGALALMIAGVAAGDGAWRMSRWPSRPSQPPARLSPTESVAKVSTGSRNSSQASSDGRALPSSQLSDGTRWPRATR